MLYSLRGILVHHDTQSLAVECGGVAYYCQATLNTLSKLSGIGKEVFVYTYMQLRQDNLDLFAFADRTELTCFKMLTTVSGVGPKAAISMLSLLTPDRLALCIASGDYKTITQAPGIGTKLAQRIVLELKDKISNVQAAAGFADTSPAGAINIGVGNIGEAIAALTALGYNQTDAASAVSSFEPSMPVADMIRAGLKALAGK